MKNWKTILLVGALVAACGSSPSANVQSTASALNDNHTPDTTGTPDLIVREDMTAHQWVVRDEDLPATACSVEEGGVTPGTRRIIRFTVGTANIGDADLYIGDPWYHVNILNDGLFEFASCHNHYHFKHYASYSLVDPKTGHIWKAAKRGFCMLDTDPNPAWLDGRPPRPKLFDSCGTKTTSGNQGISAGWTDTYRFFLGGQYFVLDGGDGQPVVPAGDYVIRIEVNPAYLPAADGSCPRVKDALTGKCHQFAESRYDNNVADFPVNIPDHPGRAGVGPAANLPGGNEIDHCDNNGKVK